MKKTILAMATTAIIGLSALFGGCSGFVMSDTKEIDDIKATLLSNGKTQITITYVDNLYPPLVFEIDKGEQGIAGPSGNGIKSFEEKIDETTGERYILITFTDPSLDDKKIPLVDGINGVSIVNAKAEPRDDGSGELDLVIYLSNDTSLRLPMPSGKDGDQVTIVEDTTSEDPTLLITITKYDGTTIEETVKIPQGEQGVGIQAIQSSQSSTKYSVIFHLTDGTNQTVEFDRPNTWLQDTKKPDDSVGLDGDFCFDTANQIIYVRENGTWIDFLDFGTKTNKFKVTFTIDADDERGEIKLSDNDKKNVFAITYGTFASNGYSVPTAELDGYEFIGWFTSRDPDFRVNGAFTDLTFVTSDMTLYPYFEKIEE